jgi:hypothetical protein
LRILQVWFWLNLLALPGSVWLPFHAYYAWQLGGWVIAAVYATTLGALVGMLLLVANGVSQARQG